LFRKHFECALFQVAHSNLVFTLLLRLQLPKSKSGPACYSDPRGRRQPSSIGNGWGSSTSAIREGTWAGASNSSRRQCASRLRPIANWRSNDHNRACRLLPSWNLEQWAKIEPHLPTNRPGPNETNDRRVLSGIMQVQRAGCLWKDCPSEYGPH
jgi:hypothetical protein